MSLEGKTVGRYRILHLLGGGGMGDVYLAEDARIGQQVAIKVIRIEVSPYPHTEPARDAARLFEREARAIVKLDHPNILPLFDYGEEPIGNLTTIYLVMPYRQEGSLADWLHRRDRTELLAPQDVVHIVRQAAEALQHAHDRQIIHQDVKPSNLLIRNRKEAPTRPDVLLADFGIARLTSATSSVSQSVRGTPSYMAPEQWQGVPVPATDQYALAMMAYELLVGRLPFQGGSAQMMYQHIYAQPQAPSTLNPRLSKEIDMVLLHGLAKTPQMRFASVLAFANALQQAVQGMQSVQDAFPLTGPTIVEKTGPEEGRTGLETRVPTVPNTPVLPLVSSEQTYIKGNDDATYVKSAPDLPVQEARSTGFTTKTLFTGNTQTTRQHITDAGIIQQGVDREPGDGSRENVAIHLPTGGITPNVHLGGHMSRPIRKRRGMFVFALILLAVAMIGGGLIYAIPSLLHSSNLNKSAGGNHRGGASSATVTITPASKDLKETYAITAVEGTPDASKNQVHASVVSTTTPAQMQTVQATGAGMTPGAHATGTVQFLDYEVSPVTLSAGTVLPNDYPTRIQIVLDAAVTIPASPDGMNPGSIGDTALHIAQVGTIGNIPQSDACANSMVPPCPGSIGFYHYYSFPGGGWDVTNTNHFAGGQDPQPYTFVQQSDIDSAANTLEQRNAPDAQQVLQPQIQANKHLIGTPQCKPNVTSDHNAGDKVTSVTVTVIFTCTGEVYDSSEVQTLTTRLLGNQASVGYALVGTVVATITDAKITDMIHGTASLTVNAEGVWAYTFTDEQKQALARLIAGKTKDEVRTLLLSQAGVKQVDVQVSGDNLPADASHIAIMVSRV